MTNCRWVAADQPRMVCTERHDRGESCDTCTACPSGHCRVCNKTHVDGIGTCGTCLAEVRQTLNDIDEKCNDLPTEVAHRGVEGEAFILLGPVANPEARGHLEASVAAGRIPPEHVGEPLGNAHPLWVAATWAMTYRAEFEHDEPINAVTLTAELSYLKRNLTDAATWPHVPFEDLARDLHNCHTHLAAVLGDTNRGERANVGCFDCGGDLERRLGLKGFDDQWTCRRCHRRYTIAEYNFALRAMLEESA